MSQYINRLDEAIDNHITHMNNWIDKHPMKFMAVLTVIMLLWVVFA